MTWCVALYSTVLLTSVLFSLSHYLSYSTSCSFHNTTDFFVFTFSSHPAIPTWTLSSLNAFSYSTVTLTLSLSLPYSHWHSLTLTLTLSHYSAYTEKDNRGANGDSNTNHFNTSDGGASGPTGLMNMSPNARSSPPLLTNVSKYWRVKRAWQPCPVHRQIAGTPFM